MKIKKVNMVSREDMEGLVNSLNYSINSIICGRPHDALWTLKRLKNNIETNLKEGVKDEI